MNYETFINDFFRRFPEMKGFYHGIQNKKFRANLLFGYQHTSDLSLLHFLSRIYSFSETERVSYINYLSTIDSHNFLKLISNSTFHSSVVSRFGYFDLVPFSSYGRNPWFEINSHEENDHWEGSERIYQTLLKIQKFPIAEDQKRMIYNTPIFRKLALENERQN